MANLDEMLRQKRPEIAEILESAIDAMQDKKIKKITVNTYGNTTVRMYQNKDGIKIEVERKLKEGLSVRYLSDIMVLFKSVFRYASREYRIRNVLDGIVIPKKNKPEIAVMNKEQQLRLEKYLDKHPSVTSVGRQSHL